MPANLKINYEKLPARDLDAAEAFHKNAFGWTFTDYGHDDTKRRRAGIWLS